MGGWWRWGWGMGCNVVSTHPEGKPVHIHLHLMRKADGSPRQVHFLESALAALALAWAHVSHASGTSCERHSMGTSWVYQASEGRARGISKVQEDMGAAGTDAAGTEQAGAAGTCTLQQAVAEKSSVRIP